MADEPSEIDTARVALAAELRRGMHLTLARDPDAAELARITNVLQQVFDELDEAPERSRAARLWRGPTELDVPADGEAFADSVDRPVSGGGNPFSIPMTMYRDGDAVVSTVVLQAGFEGAPGRSHGGFVSAIFDDLLGSLPMLHRKIAFTASLTVNYLAPSPVFEPVTYRGWIDRIEGKKMYVEGEARHDGVVVTTASGLFIDATEKLQALHGVTSPTVASPMPPRPLPPLR